MYLPHGWDPHGRWCGVVSRGRPAADGRSARRRPRASTRELSRQIVPHNSSRSICSCCGRREFFACPKGCRRCRSFFSAHETMRRASRVCLCCIFCWGSATQPDCNYSKHTDLFPQMAHTPHLFSFHHNMKKPEHNHSSYFKITLNVSFHMNYYFNWLHRRSLRGIPINVDMLWPCGGNKQTGGEFNIRSLLK